MIGGGLSPTEFLGWLQTIPGGIGHDQFMARLRAPAVEGGPHFPAPGDTAPDVATYRDPEMDEEEAFSDELERVISASDEAHDYAFDMPHGRTHAFAVLRSLPDRAGIEAFVRALRAAPPPHS